MTEAGWYYVDGDPPGTVRRWNGVEWIGFPIPAPSQGTALHGDRPTERRTFSGTGKILTVLTTMMLAIMAVLVAVLTTRVWQGAQALPGGNRRGSVAIGELGTYIDGLGDLIAGIAFCTLLTACVFIPWVRRAAMTAQIHLMKQGGTGGSRRRRRRSVWWIIAMWLIFGAVYLIWLFLQRSMDGVARGPNRSKGLLGVVTDTATAVSIDPRTGLAGISPIKILAWWALWWGPVMVGVITWTTVWILAPVRDSVLQTVVQLNAVLLGFEVISLACILATVVQISARFWR